MLKDIVLWTLTAVLPFLIVQKNDKQMVHLLEGRLFQRDGDISAAKTAYRRHKKPTSVLLIAFGCWLAVAGLVMVGTSAEGLAIAAGGAVSVLLGVFGRVRSFIDADKELG